MNVMKRTSRVPACGWALVLVLAIATPAPAFLLNRAYAPETGLWYAKRWPASTWPVPFMMSDRPLDLLPNLVSGSAPQAAVQAALQTWAWAPPGFYFGGTTSATDVGQDGINLITFADTPANRDAVGDAAAISFNWFSARSSSQAYWPFKEYDIVVNPAVKFATDGRADAFDVQAVLTHELGHALGLDHSPIASAVMWPWQYAGKTFTRSLDPDDIAGVEYNYGVLEGSPGAISGTVLTAAGAPVFGAHVVATDGDGIVTVGATTGVDGGFTLYRLPPGQYQVYAQPLVGPFTPSDTFSEFYREAQTDFLVSFAGGATPAWVSVASGKTTPIGPIQVEEQSPHLKPRFLGVSADPIHWGDTDETAVPLAAGSSAFLIVGGDGLDAATDFVVIGSDVTLDLSQATRSYSNTYAVIPFTVRPDARPGGRTLLVSNDNEIAAYTGAIKVVAP